MPKEFSVHSHHCPIHVAIRAKIAETKVGVVWFPDIGSHWFEVRYGHIREQFVFCQEFREGETSLNNILQK